MPRDEPYNSRHIITKMLELWSRYKVGCVLILPISGSVVHGIIHFGVL